MIQRNERNRQSSQAAERDRATITKEASYPIDRGVEKARLTAMDKGLHLQTEVGENRTLVCTRW